MQKSGCSLQRFEVLPYQCQKKFLSCMAHTAHAETTTGEMVSVLFTARAGLFDVLSTGCETQGRKSRHRNMSPLPSIFGQEVQLV